MLLVLVRYFFSVLVLGYMPAYRYRSEEGKFLVEVPQKFEYKPSKLWMWWDSGLYMSIVQTGYDRKPFSTETYANWGFYPLYPLMVSGISKASGFSTFNSVATVGIVFSIVCFYFALLVLRQLLKGLGFEDRDVYLVLILLALSPGSHFFHLFYTESLFLLLSVCVFLFLFRKRYALSAFCLALCMITRSNGFLLIFPVIYYIYCERKSIRFSLLLKICGLFLLSLVPLFIFYYYLYSLTGEFWAAIKILNGAWKNGFFPFGYFIQFLLHGGWGQIIYVVLLIVSMLTLFFTRKALHLNSKIASLWAYATLSVFLFSGMGLGSSIQRFLSATFPLFILPFAMSAKPISRYTAIFVTTVTFVSLQALFFIFYLINAPVYSY